MQFQKHAEEDTYAHTKNELFIPHEIQSSIKI